MDETIYKIFETCEVKKVGERQYEFTASTADMDRDGEVIDVMGWDLKNFKKNPVIMYAHDYRSLPIGKATKIGVKDGKLVNNVEFPPEGTYEFADIVERLVGTGYLKAESVGFIPKKWEDGDGGEKTPRRTYTKQELLEISIVPVPSNPNALLNAVTAGVITTKQLATITSTESTKGVAPVVPPQPAQTSQETIKDEIDYLKTLINEGGIAEGNKVAAIDLMADMVKFFPDWEFKEKIAVSKAIELKQPDMAGMKKMMTMMSDCEDKAGKAKDMAQGMMDDMKSVKPGNDIPVEDNPKEEFTNTDILESIKRINGGK